MLTDARIMAIVPTTDLARAKAFYGQMLGLTDANVPTPGPQVIYRCGGGTVLEVYERPTAGDAQHTLASWEVGDLRAAVDQLRNRGVRFAGVRPPGGQDRGRHLNHRRPPRGLVSRPRRQHPARPFPCSDVVTRCPELGQVG
jgi:catechol 2,3-dioxygenase-like lactoylglutathione lyase family enzyme